MAVWSGERLSAVAAVFENRSLRRLQVAWAGAVTADAAEEVALAVYAFRVRGVAGVGLLGLVRAVPAALASTFLAGLVDRYRSRIPMMVLACRALVFVGLALVVALDGPSLVVFVLAGIEAGVYALYWPAQAALVPNLATTPAELTATNVTSTIVENAGALAGPILAGLALAAADVDLVFVAGAMVLGLAAVAVLPLRADAAATGHQRTTDGFAGYRTLLSDRDPRLVVSLYLAQVFCLGALTVLVVTVALEMLATGAGGVGLLSAAVGIGGLVGSTAAFGFVGRSTLARSFGGTLLVCGAALAAVAVSPGRVIAAILLAVVGAANALADVSALTLLQRIVREHVLGRVLTIVEGLWWVVFGIGSVATAGLVSATSVEGALLVIGGALCAVGIGTTGALRRLDSRTTVPTRQLHALENIPMFAGQSPLARERLAFDLIPLSAAPKEVIMRRGDPGDRFYIIDSGRVRVNRPGKQVTLRAGDWFGELALLNDQPRNATVRAVDDVRLFALERQDFLDAVLNRSHGAAASGTLISHT